MSSSPLKIIAAPTDGVVRRRLTQRLIELQKTLPKNGIATTEDLRIACQIVVLKMVLELGRIDTDNLLEVFLETNPLLKPRLEADIWIYHEACQKTAKLCQSR